MASHLCSVPWIIFPPCLAGEPHPSSFQSFSLFLDVPAILCCPVIGRSALYQTNSKLPWQSHVFSSVQKDYPTTLPSPIMALTLWGGGIALSSRHRGRSKNLRYHIFNYKHEAERKVEVGLDYELSNPTTSYVLPLARLYLPNLPNSSTHWDPRIQMLESMRDISHLSYHSDQTQEPALYHWYIYQDLYHYFVNDYCMIVK